MSEHPLAPLLLRIAEALDGAADQPFAVDLSSADGFIWQADRKQLRPVTSISNISWDLLRGVDHVRDILEANTRQFADGHAANNALLWGARGMGKSSLVKAVHARINAGRTDRLALIEIHREDLPSLPMLLGALARQDRRCILFCDDLSFDAGETSYKSLKAVLEGGLEGKPGNVLFYATSNRRHLMPRQMIENERSTAIHPGESVEEKISLSDRFGLWLGFHPCDQATYLAMIDAYADHFSLKADDLHRQALEWAQTRGTRSGRVAWQFTQDLAGRLRVALRE
ncbi:MAG: ATP-binding protein [Geminicoccaceae bacterium]